MPHAYRTDRILLPLITPRAVTGTRTTIKTFMTTAQGFEHFANAVDEPS